MMQGLMQKCFVNILVCVWWWKFEDFKFRLLRTVANGYEVNIQPFFILFLCLMLKSEYKFLRIFAVISMMHLQYASSVRPD